MAGKIVGQVVHAKGSLEIRTPEGIVKIVGVGDPVHAGDVLLTGAGAEVIVDFSSGKRIEVGETAEVVLDEAVYRAQEYSVGEVVGDVDALQLAIANGMTDLAELEPTAAGPDQGPSAGVLGSTSLGAESVYLRDGREGSVDSRGTVLDPTGAVSDDDQREYGDPQDLGGQPTSPGLASSAPELSSTSPTATISIDPITADDVVNAAEAAGNIDVRGSVSGEAAPGDMVSITVNGTSYSGAVGAGNVFSISVAGSDLIADRSFDATVVGTDEAGNPFAATTTVPSTHGVDTTASAIITVDAVAGDGVVNAVEVGGSVNVTGSVGGDAAPDDIVSLVVNGTSYSGVVEVGNVFSIGVLGTDLAADTSFEVTVVGTDDAGNPFSATTVSTHEVDTSALATITVDSITSDEVVNAAEAGGNIDITGSVGGDASPGDAVSLTVNGTNYSGVVGVGNVFSISVSGPDLAADTSFDATVVGTDDAGNPFSATTTSTHTVDTTASATISVDAITADDVVNAAEAGGSINVTGTVGGDAAPGDTVSFTVNGTDYSCAVGAGNVFSISVSASDLAADTSFDTTVVGTDGAGNPFSATTTSTHGVDIAASATISVDAITADDVVDAAEAGGSIDVTGTVGGDASPGDTVSFTVNGTDYSGAVGAGNVFSISVSASDLVADTSFDATVVGTDDAGNSFSATTTSTHGVDTSTSATIVIDTITSDDVVNAAESGGSINVTGTVGGDASSGATVSFTVNGTDYSGVVGVGNVFSISVSGPDLAADTSFDATVVGADDAGNSFSVTTTSTHGVDTTASATIVVDPITVDDVVNAA